MSRQRIHLGSRPAASRLGGQLVALALLLGALAAVPAPAGAGTVTAPTSPTTASAADGLAACARPALAPTLRLGRPGEVELEVGSPRRTRKQARVAHRVATRGRRMQMPARAQALAVAAALAGDLPEKPDSFYRRLKRVEGWQNLPPTIVVHRVLGTPDPFAYEAWWDRGVRLLGKMMVGEGSIEARVSPGGRSPARCYASAADRKSLPLPPGSGYQVRPARPAERKPAKGEKKPETPQKPGETGFEAACGTPVLAATPGTVEIVRDEPAAGPWTIKVRQEDAGISTHYTHVQDVVVEDGATVLVGQPLADVGDLGAVDRCTLGISLTRKRNGRTQVLDPATWLAPRKASKAKKSKPEPSGPVTVPATTFKVGSYNVLGERLTRGRPGWGAGTTRTARGMARVAAHGISVLVLNELEHGQAGVVRNHGWALHRATFDNANGHGSAIAWRPGEWKALDTGEIATPVRRRQLHHPTALLEHVETGARVWVLGVHNPVDMSYSQARARRVSEGIQKTWVNGVRDEAPVIVGGDFNDREPARRSMTGSGVLQTPAPGGRHPVDWIFGTTDLDFTGETVERFERARISDHPLIVAGAVIPEHERARESEDDEE